MNLNTLPAVTIPGEQEQSKQFLSLLTVYSEAPGRKSHRILEVFRHLLLNLPSTFVKELKQINPRDPSVVRLTWDLLVISATNGKSKVPDITASACGGGPSGSASPKSVCNALIARGDEAMVHSEDGDSNAAVCRDGGESGLFRRANGGCCRVSRKIQPGGRTGLFGLSGPAQPVSSAY